VEIKKYQDMHRILQSVKDLFIDFSENNDNIKNIALLHNNVNAKLSDFDIAIMGLADEREIDGINKIRKEFYRLFLPEKAKIIDFGNFILDYHDANVENLLKILNVVWNNNLKLLVIGGKEENNLYFFKFFNLIEKQIISTTIGAEIDFAPQEATSNKFFLNYIYKNPKVIEKHYHLGYQNYLFNFRLEEKLKQSKIKKIRLSQVRNDILDYEPSIRQSTLVSFDLTAIKYADCPATTTPQPNGFSALEACELAYWTGMSRNVKIFGIYEYNYLRDIDGISAKLSAQILWHFIYAYYLSNKNISSNNNYNTFYVKIKQNEKNIKLKFKQDKRSNLWELEINNKIYFCSLKDFQTTQKGDLSPRIKEILEKL
jgi:formiminoglutamase